MIGFILRTGDPASYCHTAVFLDNHVIFCNGADLHFHPLNRSIAELEAIPISLQKLDSEIQKDCHLWSMPKWQVAEVSILKSSWCPSSRYKFEVWVILYFWRWLWALLLLRLRGWRSRSTPPQRIWLSRSMAVWGLDRGFKEQDLSPVEFCFWIPSTRFEGLCFVWWEDF